MLRVKTFLTDVIGFAPEVADERVRTRYSPLLPLAAFILPEQLGELQDVPSSSSTLVDATYSTHAQTPEMRQFVGTILTNMFSLPDFDRIVRSAVRDVLAPLAGTLDVVSAINDDQAKRFRDAYQIIQGHLEALDTKTETITRRFQILDHFVSTTRSVIMPFQEHIEQIPLLVGRMAQLKEDVDAANMQIPEVLHQARNLQVEISTISQNLDSQENQQRADNRRLAQAWKEESDIMRDRIIAARRQLEHLQGQYDAMKLEFPIQDRPYFREVKTDILTMRQQVETLQKTTKELQDSTAALW
jgi:hypothetical protein